MTTAASVVLDGRHADDGPQRLEVRDGALHITLRALSSPLVVPLSDVAVVARHRSPADPPLRRAPVLPFAQLQGATTAANLLVVFHRPVRVPPVRVQPGGTLSLDRRRSMSPEGVHIDGMWFAADDPGTAVERLAAAGLPVAHDAAPVVAQVVGTDPNGVPEAATSRATLRRVQALLVLAFVGFVVLLAGTALRDGSGWMGAVAFFLGFPALAGGFCGALWLTYRRPTRGVAPSDRGG